MPKICVIGSLNMDMVVTSPRLPQMGESVIGYDFMMCPGGKGNNQAVAAARLGADVVMGGCVGEDIFGKELRDNLIINNVNADYIETIKGKSSGIALITLYEGDNAIVVDPGANFRVPEELCDRMEMEIKNSDFLLLQLEISMPAINKAIEIAKRNNTKIFLDPAPIRDVPDEILANVDYIKPNQSEASYLTKMSVDTIEDARDAIRILQRKTSAKILITMGEQGVVYSDEGKIRHFPAYKVDAVDTTAAGDAFSAAFAVKAAGGKNVEEALKFSSQVSALTVMKKGAQPSLPTKWEVDNWNDR